MENGSIPFSSSSLSEVSHASPLFRMKVCRHNDDSRGVNNHVSSIFLNEKICAKKSGTKNWLHR